MPDPDDYGLAGVDSDPYTQQLLKLAQAQGGATAQTAGELVHPNGSFLTMTKDKLGNAFQGVQHLISTPEETLAAGMSKFSGNPMSLKDAYSQHVQPSEVLFGKGPATTPAGKATRAATGIITDTLLDPLTYATTGRYGGILGLSKLPSVPVGKYAAKALGWSNLFKGPKGWEAVRHATLSRSGADARAQMIKSAAANLRNDTLEKAGFTSGIKLGFEGVAELGGEFIPGVDVADTALIASQAAKAAASYANRGVELSTSLPGVGRYFNAGNIASRVGSTLVKMAGMGASDILKAETGPGAEGMAAIRLARIATDSKLVQKPVGEMTSAELDAWDKGIWQATKQAMDDQANRLADHVLNSKRADIEDAVGQNMKRIMEKNAVNGNVIVDSAGKPVLDQFGNKQIRNLADQWLDKGGFKYFGKTIVSGVRIRQAMNLVIPAEDRVQKWGPWAAKTLAAVSDARNKASSLFSTKWDSEGRIPDSVLRTSKNLGLKLNAQTHEFITNTGRIMKKMNINEPEMRTVMAAIQLGKRPAEAPNGRLTALYDMMHSQQGNSVMKDIANGVYGDGTKPEDVQRMWAVANYVKKQLQQNLVMMRDAGMSVYEHENYVPLLLNQTKKAISPYMMTKSTEAANAMKSEFAKFTNVKDPTQIHYGTADRAVSADGKVISLKQYSKVEERNRISKQIDKLVLSGKEKTAGIKNEIEEIWGKVNARFKKSVYAPNEGALKEAAGEDKYNYKALQKAFEDSIPDVDRKALVERAAAKVSESVDNTIKGAHLKPEDITKLREDLKTGDEDIDSMVKRLMLGASELSVSTGKTAATEAAKTAEEANYEKALQQMKSLVKENGMNLKQEMVKEALGKDSSFKETLQKLSDEWHANPEGVSGYLNQISGREQKVEELMSHLSDTKTKLEGELKQPGLKQVNGRWFYKDAEGNAYERERATAEEINKNYFDSQEMFSEDPIKPFLAATENTLRTVNAKYLMQNIAEDFGVPASEAPSNYVSVKVAGLSEKEGDLADFLSKSSGAKKLETLVYHPAIAQTMVDMMRVMNKDPASQDLLASFDKLTNLFKVSVTAPFLAFHGRNAMSNVWQSMMDIGYHALSPAKHMMASKLVMNNRQLENLMLEHSINPTAENLQKYWELSDRPIMTDRAGHQWTVGELDRVLRDNVVAYNSTSLGMMDAGLSTEERNNEVRDMLFEHTNKFGAGVKKALPISQRFFLFEQGRNLSNYLESQPRILNFLANLENTGDVGFAANQTKQFLYDHTNLTSFERNFLRRVIPFYAYTRKNIEGMVQTMIHKPGRLEWFRNSYTNVGDAMAGGNLNRQEREALPPWMRDGLDLVVARNGNNVKLITSMGSPFEAPFDEIGNLFGSMNPLIKGPVEQATGYSFFEDKPLSQVTDATAFKHAPQSIKDLIGFTTKTYTDSTGNVHEQYVSLNPKMMNMFNNLPLTSRTLSSLALIQNPNVDTQSKILANLFGIKPTTIDLDSEEYQRQKELDAQIQDILTKSGVGYTRTEYTAPTGTTLPLPPTNPENQ